VLCPSCLRLEHDCDPVTYWCACPCGTGEHLDPVQLLDALYGYLYEGEGS
jgi:hypothetical protein